jgi:hypothetical protein
LYESDSHHEQSFLITAFIQQPNMTFNRELRITAKKITGAETERPEADC